MMTEEEMAGDLSYPVVSMEPGNDERLYRRCLGSFATGVTIITASVGEEYIGITANSFSSVSMSPPLILWSISYNSASLPVVRAASHFAVNILSLRQQDLANQFARSGGDKFFDVEWREGAGGAPLLPDTVASLECRNHAMYDVGDHLVVIGQVEKYSLNDRRPLLFTQGRYGQSVSHPEFVEKSQPSPVNGRPVETTNRLLRRAYLSCSNAFQGERDAEGVQFNQSRVLSGIVRYPGKTAEFLAKELFLDELELRDTLQELVMLGFVRPGGSGFEPTPIGAAKFSAIKSRHVAFENEIFSGIDPEEMEKFRNILVQISTY